jgi:glycerol uptake facilitator-like aquaporin
MNINIYIAEFLGTLFLTFIIFATGNYLAIGAALALGVLMAGPISGAAFNPAVAITLLVAGKISKSQIIPYIIAELAGGLAAYQLYKTIYK